MNQGIREERQVIHPSWAFQLSWDSDWAAATAWAGEARGFYSWRQRRVFDSPGIFALDSASSLGVRSSPFPSEGKGRWTPQGTAVKCPAQCTSVPADRAVSWGLLQLPGTGTRSGCSCESPLQSWAGAQLGWEDLQSTQTRFNRGRLNPARDFLSHWKLGL